MKNFKFLLAAAMLMGTTATVFADFSEDAMGIQAPTQLTKLQYNPKLSIEEQKELEKKITVYYIMYEKEYENVHSLRDMLKTLSIESSYFAECNSSDVDHQLCTLFGKDKKQLFGEKNAWAAKRALIQQVAWNGNPQLIARIEKTNSDYYTAHEEILKNTKKNVREIKDLLKKY